MQPREADSAAVALQFLDAHGPRRYARAAGVDGQHHAGARRLLLAFRIRYHAKLRGTAVMMIANSGKPGDAIACRENGISAYLRQPIAESDQRGDLRRDGRAGRWRRGLFHADHAPPLREMKAGSVLVIDPNREHALIAVPAEEKDYRGCTPRLPRKRGGNSRRMCSI